MIQQFTAWSGLPPAAGELLRNWDKVPYYRNGRLAAVAILNGTEIHFACAPEQRHSLLQRGRIQEFLRPILARRGYLTTRSMDPSADRFLTRLGFVHTWREGEVDHYMLSELPFARE